MGVQRLLAEVRRNQSQKLIVRQEIIQTQNRINFLCGRYPQLVERFSAQFLDLQLQALRVGVPSQLLLNRPDIRQAERELQAAGIDIRVARANFFPKVIITSGIGYEAFQPQYLFYTPESLIYSVAGGLVAPVVNRRAIQAEFLNANARQLQALTEYQRTVLNAFTEVVNRVSKVQNYSQAIELKKLQLTALESAVDFADKLFQNARINYLEVLTALQARNDARHHLDRDQARATLGNRQRVSSARWRMAVRGRTDSITAPRFPRFHASAPTASPAGKASRRDCSAATGSRGSRPGTRGAREPATWSGRPCHQASPNASARRC